jgi:predicted enzyme related to lactoylglutathione lyase
MEDKFRTHGAFSWFELMTTDVEKAKAFYARLFGWTFEQYPMEGMSYSVVKAAGEDAGGLMATPSEAQGMPPMWGIYVTVQNVDETAKLARELGGKVLMEPRDIPQVGRFCVIQDPQGAVISAITYAPME